jgi:hypothetical protein
MEEKTDNIPYDSEESNQTFLKIHWNFGVGKKKP